MHKRNILAVSALILSFCQNLSAQQIPTGQDTGSTLRGYVDQKMQKATERRANKGYYSKVPAINAPRLKALPEGKNAVHVKEIALQQKPGMMLDIDQNKLIAILDRHSNKDLTLSEMELLADLIVGESANSDLEAYIPEQTFEGNLLYINIILPS